jgi:hypothetical protein
MLYWDHAPNDHVQAQADLGILGLIVHARGLGRVQPALNTRPETDPRALAKARPSSRRTLGA